MPDSMSSGANIDTPPSSPPATKFGTLGYAEPSQSGMGEAASDPQVQALRGVKMMQMGAQVLSNAVPEVAGPVQQFIQQLAVLVPQMMAQQQSGAPAGMTGPSPVPAGPPAG